MHHPSEAVSVVVSEEALEDRVKEEFYAKIKTDFQMEPYLLSTNLSSKSNREQ